MKKIENVLYSNKHEEKLDVYLPETEGFTTVVYFHGGGLAQHGKACEGAVNIADSFVKKGYAFVSADYRIYPDAKFPEFLVDGADAIAYVKAHLNEWGGNGKIIVSGQSAGAWMSIMLCLDKQYLGAVGIDPMEISGWIIDSSQMTAHFNVLKYETGCDPNLQRINEYAPLYYLDGNTRFNRMLILFYENDMPCRAEQNMLFIKAAQTLCPANDLQYKMLKGAHCQGSVSRDESGQYAFVAETLAWLK